jgi:hypothetical protein
MYFQFITKIQGRKTFVEGLFNDEDRFEIETCVDEITGLDVTLTQDQELDIEQDAFERIRTREYWEEESIA